MTPRPTLSTLHRMVLRLRLFIRLVWREWEPASCGIPDEYRIHYRIPVREAWRIASDIYAPNAGTELPPPDSDGGSKKKGANQ